MTAAAPLWLRHLPDILNDCARATVLRRLCALLDEPLVLDPRGELPPRHCDCTSPLQNQGLSRQRCTRRVLSLSAAARARPGIRYGSSQQHSSSDHVSTYCPLLMPTLPSGCTLPFTLRGAGRKKKVTCFTIPSCLLARRIEMALFRFLFVLWSHNRFTCK